MLYRQGVQTQLRNPSDVAGRIYVTLLINLLVGLPRASLDLTWLYVHSARVHQT